MSEDAQGRFDRDLAAFPTFEADTRGLRLLGSRCTACGTLAFPRRMVCLECHGKHEPSPLSGEGVLHSWTTIENPPAGFDEGFHYGCVDLVEGPRVLAALRGTPRVDAPVRAVADRVRDGEDGFRFEVVDA